MTTVAISGKKYSCPFDGLFSPLTTSELASLTASVADVGRFLQPVITCTIPGVGACLIDGMHRHQVSEKLKIPVMITDLGELTMRAAEVIARDANDRRRHLTPEQVAKSREERDATIVKLREKGLSVREIAEKTGASKNTVARTLSNDDSGVPYGTPEDDSECNGQAFTQGRDGKIYRQAPRVSVRPTQMARDPEPEPEPVIVESQEVARPPSPSELAASVESCSSRVRAVSVLLRTLRLLGYSAAVEAYESRWTGDRSPSRGKRKAASRKARKKSAAT